MNRRKFIGIIGVASTTGLAGCSGETESSEAGRENQESEPEEELEPEPQTSTVDFTVESMDGEPINDAVVSIEEGRVFSDSESVGVASTDESGVGVVENIEQGDYIASITHPDYENSEEEISLDSEQEEHTFNLSSILYSIGESVEVEEENIRVEVISSDEGPSFASTVADGIYRIVRMEVTNIGDESVNVGHDTFRLKERNSSSLYEPDDSLSINLQHGIEGFWESINPDVTTTIDVIFDIPEDIDPFLTFGAETGYMVELEE